MTEGRGEQTIPLEARLPKDALFCTNLFVQLPDVQKSEYNNVVSLYWQGSTEINGNKCKLFIEKESGKFNISISRPSKDMLEQPIDCSNYDPLYEMWVITEKDGSVKIDFAGVDVENLSVLLPDRKRFIAGPNTIKSGEIFLRKKDNERARSPFRKLFDKKSKQAENEKPLLTEGNVDKQKSIDWAEFNSMSAGETVSVLMALKKAVLTATPIRE